MYRFVPPFQGLEKIATTTRGGAALCPGLICSGPFRAIHRAIQPHHNHHRPMIYPGPFGVTNRATEDFERGCNPSNRIPCTDEFRLGFAATTTRGGAALCPGLICSGPFRATHRATEDFERRCQPTNRILVDWRKTVWRQCRRPLRGRSLCYNCRMAVNRSGAIHRHVRQPRGDSCPIQIFSSDWSDSTSTSRN